jgi:hypothetical protein
MLRILKEDVVVRAWSIEIEEANIERTQLGGLKIGEPMRGGKIKVPGRGPAITL